MLKHSLFGGMPPPVLLRLLFGENYDHASVNLDPVLVMIYAEKKHYYLCKSYIFWLRLLGVLAVYPYFGANDAKNVL